MHWLSPKLKPPAAGAAAAGAAAAGAPAHTQDISDEYGKWSDMIDTSRRRRYNNGGQDLIIEC